MVWWTKSNFSGLFDHKSGKDQWDCEIGDYFVALLLQQWNLLPLLEYLFWPDLAECCYVTLLWNCVLAQEIQLGSPDHFLYWEGGVCGQDYLSKLYSEVSENTQASVSKNCYHMWIWLSFPPSSRFILIVVFWTAMFVQDFCNLL